MTDKVRIRGKIEVHPEGSYHLQWREEKARCRLPVPEMGNVPELARRLELERKRPLLRRWKQARGLGV